MRLVNADTLPRTQVVERRRDFKNGRISMRHVITQVVRVEDLEKAPTVDAESVHYGRWITINKGFDNWVECSECNTVGSPFWKRCPVCEAKMKGVGNNAVD